MGSLFPPILPTICQLLVQPNPFIIGMERLRPKEGPGTCLVTKGDRALHCHNQSGKGRVESWESTVPSPYFTLTFILTKESKARR